MKRINNIISYLQGWTRYHLYYSRFSWLIRKHIREQIEMRINSMNPECYSTGSCIECGCSTTALQMCNKACEGDCYPKMLSKYGWGYLKSTSKHKGHYTLIDKYSWRVDNNRFEKV